MKRKALITSTALLLVALICLATASYAWFTSGNSNTIAEISMSVSAGDSALMVTPADLSNGYAEGTYVTSLTDDSFDGGIGINNPGDANGSSDGAFLRANSTTGVFNADGELAFIKPDSYANNTWTMESAATFANKNGYVVYAFWAKSAVAATAKLNVTLTGGSSDKKTAVKIGYVGGLTAAPAASNSLGIYALDGATESIDRLSVAGGTSTWNGTKFVASEGTFTNGTDSAYTATALGGTVTFAADTPQLFVVAVWLEGQDAQCQGTYDASALALNINFSNYEAITD